MVFDQCRASRKNRKHQDANIGSTENYSYSSIVNNAPGIRLAAITDYRQFSPLGAEAEFLPFGNWGVTLPLSEKFQFYNLENQIAEIENSLSWTILAWNDGQTTSSTVYQIQVKLCELYLEKINFLLQYSAGNQTLLALEEKVIQNFVTAAEQFSQTMEIEYQSGTCGMKDAIQAKLKLQFARQLAQ